MGNGFKWFVGVVLVVLVIAAISAGMKFNALNKQNKADFDAEKATAISEAVGLVTSEKDAQIKDLNTQITNLNAKITELQAVEEEVIAEEEKVAKGYIIDEIYLEGKVTDLLSDRDLNTLFDGTVRFDNEDYDAEETFDIKMFLKANDNDFEGIPYLTFEEDDLVYKFDFETSLITGDIKEDETLVFNLLGKEVEISKWVDDKITFTQGDEYYLYAGDSVVIDGQTVVLDFVLDDAVYVLVDGVGKKIEEGSARVINGLEIKAKEVLYSGRSDIVSRATLVIGNDVELTVYDSDEYEKNSIWEWIIDDNSIGVKLIEDFTELDEDYNALAPEGTICLPNDYICIQYNGVIEEDSEDYSFEIEDSFVEIKGNFEFGTEDYDKIYIFTDGLIYEDDNTEDYIGEEVNLGDTELKLKVDAEWITIDTDEFKVKLALDDAEVNGVPICSKDYDYMSDYGILVENPDNACEDKQFEISIPEEQLEATISVY